MLCAAAGGIMSKECSVKGCDKTAVARGYCQSHYNRWHAHGDPEVELVYIRSNMIKMHPREYRSWQSMNTRCNNPNRQEYPRYGGRGIKVCERWAERPYVFSNFYEDMGDRPKGATLDRVDPDGDYCPENCRWTDAYIQSSNRRYVGYLYIYPDKRNGRFYVRVKREKNIYNGAFATLEEAIIARNDALKLFGLEDLLNKIKKGEIVCH